jgi:uncharacterized membrane protein (UPF0127 family)
VSQQQREAVTRRHLLAGIGAVAGSGALAGCTTSGDDADDSGTADDESAGSTDSTDPDGSADSDDEDTPGDDGSGRADDDSAGSDDAGDGTDDTGDGGDTGDGNDGGSESDCAGRSVHESYEEMEIQIATPDGEQLGSVTAAVADTDATRATGLSETECLPPDRGMLFVYDQQQSLNFWMINMDFGIDIVYIDDEGVITSIHHADAPAEDESGTEEHHQYPGEGRYVLEVNLGWTTDRGVEAGDVVTIEPQ